MARKVPVFLEPTKDRKIAVFGGGMVAYRKCRQFEGFDITVIADRTVPEMDSVCDRIVLAHFDPSDLDQYLDGVFIAVAATDSKALNAAITETAKKHGCLVNSAHGGGDVLLPSSVRKENYTVAVSSEGSVPAFPPYVAKMIDGFLGPEYDLMMDLLRTLRKDLQEKVPAAQEGGIPGRGPGQRRGLGRTQGWRLRKGDGDRPLDPGEIHRPVTIWHS